MCLRTVGFAHNSIWIVSSACVPLNFVRFLLLLHHHLVAVIVLLCFDAYRTNAPFSIFVNTIFQIVLLVVCRHRCRATCAVYFRSHLIFNVGTQINFSSSAPTTKMPHTFNASCSHILPPPRSMGINEEASYNGSGHKYYAYFDLYNDLHIHTARVRNPMNTPTHRLLSSNRA